MMLADVSLRAPIAVPVEIRANAGRTFRLAWNIGEDGLRLAAELPFEPGRPVQVRFRLPDGEGFSLAAEVADPDAGDSAEDGRGSTGEPRSWELVFVEPPSEARIALRRYVHQRLELPA
jgi:hypothetical protein